MSETKYLRIEYKPIRSKDNKVLFINIAQDIPLGDEIERVRDGLKTLDIKIKKVQCFEVEDIPVDKYFS